MTASAINAEKLFNIDEPTDIEIAMSILRFLDDSNKFDKFQDPINERTLMLRLAENALKTMTNPFAKKMLMDKIIE